MLYSYAYQLVEAKLNIQKVCLATDKECPEGRFQHQLPSNSTFGMWRFKCICSQTRQHATIKVDANIIRSLDTTAGTDLSEDRPWIPLLRMLPDGRLTCMCYGREGSVSTKKKLNAFEHYVVLMKTENGCTEQGDKCGVFCSDILHNKLPKFIAVIFGDSAIMPISTGRGTTVE